MTARTLRARATAALRLAAGRGWIALLALAFAAGGWWLRAALAPVGTAAPPADAGHADHAPAAAAEVWTCSMHPQIRMPAPGPCPICGMDLVPEEQTGEEEGERRLTLSPAARALTRIETSPVERRFVEAEVRMVGKIEVDETRLADITARVEGRIDRMFVDYTGVEVQLGDHLVDLYSPKLYADQRALLEAAEAVRAIEEGRADAEAERAYTLLDAARERLRQLGLTREQVAEIERRGTPSDHLTLYAPAGGVVVDRQGQVGRWVEKGTRIYTIADLTHLWVQLDAYESDLPWLHYGQPVEFTTEAYPGEIFEGTIAFLSPVLDDRTRTVKVRVNLANPERKLKPDMFVRAVVRTRVASGGRAMDPDLAGRWICPMHPEVLRDEPGDCDVCGMDLVTTESRGFVAATAGEPPLVIPTTAPLLTGERAVVYVEVDRDEQGGFVYEGREVVLGPRAGDHYIVERGLAEGERVVTRGNFKIDSALQIRARPSMMAPAGGGAGDGDGEAPPRAARPDLPAAFADDLAELWRAYLPVHAALAGDDDEAALAAGAGLARALEAVDAGALDDPGTRERWDALAGDLDAALRRFAAAEGLEPRRVAFEDVAAAVIAVARGLGAGGAPVYVVECPMALGDGALWPQADGGVANPYYGASMATCGSVVEVLEPAEDAEERR